MKTFVGAFVVLLLTPCLAAAHPAAKPGPEVQALGYYIGSWTGHGETVAGPFGPAGKLSSKNRCEWFAGSFQVVCRGEERGPTGVRSFMAIKSYDPRAHTYPEYSISSAGESEYDPGGSLDGNTLTYIVKQDAGRKHTKLRYTEVHVSPVLYTYKTEVSVDAGPWTLLATGEIKKVR